MGRGARGVKAITMRGDDEVVAMEVTDENTRLLTITETGYGRVSLISDYRLQSRGGKGLMNYRVDKYGDVAAVLEITDEDDIIMIASNGILIRIYSGDISTFARPAKGVRVMRVGEGEKVLSVAVTEHNGEEPTEQPDAPEADAGVAEDNSPEEELETENTEE